MKRTVEMKRDSWLWSIVCPDCPLKAASELLGQRPPDCSAGALTNMQGAVTISACKHYAKESISVSEEKVITLECNFETPPHAVGEGSVKC